MNEVPMAMPDVAGHQLVDLLSLDGRAAVVTGAGRGIGRATARRLAEAGASLVLTDRDGAQVASEAAAISADFGIEAIGLAVDVTSPAQVVEAATTAVSELGRLDIWVNNAGIFPRDEFLDLDVQRWDEVQHVNARGVFLGAQAAAREMAAAGRGGTILNVASTAGFRGGALGYSHYAASKHAVVGLTKSLASELGPHRIRVLGVAPSATETPGIVEGADDGGQFFHDFGRQLPVGRSGVPDDIARVVLFLVSDLAMFMTGTTVLVDGGATARSSERFPGSGSRQKITRPMRFNHES